MSAEFSGGYMSIQGQSGGNEDDRGSFEPHQYEGIFYPGLFINLTITPIQASF